MHAWEQIQQTIQFIEEHLEEEIQISDLARMASLSPFYYQRLFSRLVKKPVAEYIKLRRMAKATEALLDTNARILDIALSLGFSAHEHFTRTFKDTFGITPEEYRSHPLPLNCMSKPNLFMQYTLIDEGAPLLADGIVLEIKRQEIREPLVFSGLEMKLPVQFVDGLGLESGIDPLDTLWQRFHQHKERLWLQHDAEEIGVAYPCSETGYFLYFAGAKVQTEAAVPDCASWTLSPGNYLVCSFEAENFKALVMDALYKAQQYLFQVWLPHHKLQTEPFCAERYASHSMETTKMELWLKLLQ